MDALNHEHSPHGQERTGPHSSESENVTAWEMIAEGRYRPRRIRGSLLGRDLG